MGCEEQQLNSSTVSSRYIETGCTLFPLWKRDMKPGRDLLLGMNGTGFVQAFCVRLFACQRKQLSWGQFFEDSH